MSNTTATYTKLRDGSWGIRGARLTAGASVTVTKRDGTAKVETVGRILWTGPDGTCLATITASTITTASAPRRSGSGRCRGCGGPIVNARHHRAMDGYCGSCAFDEFDM